MIVNLQLDASHYLRMETGEGKFTITKVFHEVDSPDFKWESSIQLPFKALENFSKYILLAKAELENNGYE